MGRGSRAVCPGLSTHKAASFSPSTEFLREGRPSPQSTLAGAASQQCSRQLSSDHERVLERRDVDWTEPSPADRGATAAAGDAG